MHHLTNYLKMEKLGLSFATFEVNLKELRLKDLPYAPPYVDKGDRVEYKGRDCIVVYKDFRIGEDRIATIRLLTNNPEDYIRVYDASDIIYLSPMGIEVRAPHMSRWSEEEYLREKYSNYDLPEGFDFACYKELDTYLVNLTDDGEL